MLIMDIVPRDRRCAGVVLIGDGRMDLRILGAIAQKIKGDKILCYPQMGRSVGLLGLANALSMVLQEGSPASNYLLVIDREHTRGEPRQELLRHLSSHGIRCEEAETHLECHHGPRTFNVYLAVMGSHECGGIEWNLRELVRLERNIQISCNKREFRRWLNRNRLRDVELIRRAQYDNLRRAFECLVNALEALSRDP